MHRKRRETRPGTTKGVRTARQRGTLASDYAAASLPKHPPQRNRKLREWIAKQECLVSVLFRRLNPDANPSTLCWAYKVHAAHVPTGTGGMGMKGDDLFVPLCFHHHIEGQHWKGVKTFMALHRIDLLAEGERYLAEFNSQQTVRVLPGGHLAITPGSPIMERIKTYRRK